MAVTFDPANKSSRITLSNGDLTATEDATGTPQAVRTTLQKTAGKWYAEFTIATSATGVRLGIVNPSQSMTASLSGANAYSYNQTGTKSHTVDNESYGASYAAGDTIGVAVDLDAAQITFYKNNSSQTVAYTGITSASGWMFAYSDNNGTGGASAVTINNGATAFTYTPPAGFAGMDSPPEASHGNAAVTLERFTALGRRQAAGAVTLQQFTAVGGYHGLGRGVMQPLQVLGAGGPRAGAVALESLIAQATGHQASTSFAVFQPFDAQGTGTVESITFGENDLPVLALDASGAAGAGGTLSNVMPLITLEAGSNGASIDLLMLEIDALLTVGNAGQFVSTLPILTSDATGFLSILSTGNSTLPAITLAAVGLGENQGAFSGNIPKLYTTAIGFSGGVAALAGQVPVLSLAAIGYGPYVGTVDLLLPSIDLDADGFSAVAAALRTWVLNLRKKGLTEYNNFGFNSYAEYRGTILAAGVAGVLKLSAANNDAGTAIDAQVRTGAEGFGTSYNKRVPRIYVGYSTDGAMHFSTITSQDGKRTYLLPHNGITKIQQRRVPVGRGPKSPYWQYECTNVAGSDFLLEHIAVYPEKGSRRVV